MDGGGALGRRMTIQSAQPVFQTSEFWEMDGASRPYVLQQYKHAKLAKGQSQTFQNLIFVSGAKRDDKFEARQAGPQAMLVKGHTATGDHLALIGVHGQIPLDAFWTDAEIYDVVGNTIHLAGATKLQARIGTEMCEVFWADKPVNLLLDCQTGKGQIEVIGDCPVRAKAGRDFASYKPGRSDVTVAAADVLPKPGAMVEAMWARSHPAETGVAESWAQRVVFEAKVSDKPLQRPLKLLTNVAITVEPPPAYHRRSQWMWNTSDNLEITLSLPEAEDLGCLRVAGANLPPPPVVGRNPVGAEWLGTMGPYYQRGDLKFSLVFSDDGFKNDLRKVDDPKVTTEWTSYPPADHSTMQHFLTWRIEAGAEGAAGEIDPAHDRARAGETRSARHRVVRRRASGRAVGESFGGGYRRRWIG